MTTVTQTSAVFLKGKVYMPGGWLSGFTAVYTKMQILKPGTNSWSVDTQLMPTAVAQASVSSGAKVYVVDGIAASGQLQSKLQIYDPAIPSTTWPRAAGARTPAPPPWAVAGWSRTRSSCPR